MTKSLVLRKTIRACAFALCLIFMALSVPVAAQNNSNGGGTSATPATGGGTQTTTTTTTQTTRSGEVQTDANQGGFPWIWVIVLGLVAIVAIAFFATRSRGANRREG